MKAADSRKPWIGEMGEHYEYAYDMNVNRSVDGRTALEFSCNLLNLPCEVRDSQDNMEMRYTYLSDGTKSSTSSLSTDSAFRYRYARKEEQRFGAFDSQLLDFGARFYDPWSCQWTAVDPIWEKYVGMTPYWYCAGIPIALSDPDGASPKDKIVAFGIGAFTNIIPNPGY